MENWRLLNVETPRNAGMNMAIDEAILLAMTNRIILPTVRFWQNDCAVVIGYSQSFDVEVNVELCEKEEIQVIRRFSGGGAVYHDLGNLNYTLVMHSGHRFTRDLGIQESYRVFCSGIIEGLKALGLNANFSPLSDIVIKDKKVSGSSQARKRDVLLHHGTLLVDSNLKMLNRVLDVPRENIRGRKVTSIKKPVTSLKNELDSEIEIVEVKRVIVRGFEKYFSIKLIDDELSSKEKETAQILYDTKYSQKKWNFWREEK